MKTSSFRRSVVIAIASSVAMLWSAGSARAQTPARDMWVSGGPMSASERYRPDFRFTRTESSILRWHSPWTDVPRGWQAADRDHTLPGGDHPTPTLQVRVTGDSLVVNEHGDTPARVLHRSGAVTAPRTIVGDWTIPLGSGMQHLQVRAERLDARAAQDGDERAGTDTRGTH